MINGKTKVCGVIGNPVGHSMSPAIHNLFAEKTGADMVYVPFEVAEDQVAEAVKGAWALNLQGVNVTVPHKQNVMPYLVEIDEAAAAIGAVNTLVRTERGFKGYNTDAAGLGRAMAEAGISIKGEDCILIGAGGAAKAAAYLLAKEGAASIWALNRSLEKGKQLAEEINERFGKTMMQAKRLEDYGELPAGSYLAVQCTSVGMHPHTECAPIEDPAFYRQIHTGVDVIYTPMETRFMQLVKAAGGKAVNGLDMLLYQGIEAFERWYPDVKIDQETAGRARERMLEQLSARENGHE